VGKEHREIAEHSYTSLSLQATNFGDAFTRYHTNPNKLLPDVTQYLILKLVIPQKLAVLL
jgi:hypothetical protein